MMNATTIHKLFADHYPGTNMPESPSVWLTEVQRNHEYKYKYAEIENAIRNTLDDAYIFFDRNYIVLNDGMTYEELANIAKNLGCHTGDKNDESIANSLLQTATCVYRLLIKDFWSDGDFPVCFTSINGIVRYNSQAESILELLKANAARVLCDANNNWRLKDNPDVIVAAAEYTKRTTGILYWNGESDFDEIVLASDVTYTQCLALEIAYGDGLYMPQHLKDWIEKVLIP